MKTKKILFGSTLLFAAAMSFCTPYAHAYGEYLKWNGTKDSYEWNTTDVNWIYDYGYDEKAVFTTQDHVTFDGSAEYTSVLIDSSITSRTITISDVAYTFIFSDKGSLSANRGSSTSGTTLTINSGASLTIEGSGEMTISGPTSLMVDSTLKIAGGMTTVFDGLSVGGTVEISEGTTTTAGSVTLTGGTLRITGGVTTLSLTAQVRYYTSGREVRSACYISGGETTIQGASVSASTLSITGGATTFTYSTTIDCLYQGQSASLSISGGTVTFTKSVSVGYYSMLSISGGNVTFSDSVTIKNNNDSALSFTGGTITLSSAISNSGTATIGSGVTFVLDNLTDEDGTYTIISNNDSGTISGWDTLTKSNFSLNGSELSGHSAIDVSTAGQVTITTVSVDLVWNGTASSNVWTNDGENIWLLNDGSSDAFISGDSVTFDDTAESKTVIVEGSVNADSVAVKSGEYTFTGDGSITTESLVVDSGASLSLEGPGELTIDSATISGSLEISDSATLTVDSSVSVSGKLEISDSATLTANSTMSVSGELDLSGETTTKISSSVTINASGTIKVSDDAALTMSNAVDIYGTLEISGGETTFSGGTYVYDGGTLEISDGITTFSSDVYIYEGGTIEISGGEAKTRSSYSGTMYVYGTLEISDGEVNILNRMRVYSGGTLEISGGETTFSNSIYIDYSNSDYGTGTLEISGGETTFTGNLFVGYSNGSSNSGSGTMNIYEGETTFTADVYVGHSTYSGYTSTSGSGTIEIYGGTTIFSADLVVGYVDSSSYNHSSGTLKIHDGTVIFENSVYIGYFAYSRYSSGTIEISGGETTVSGHVNIGSSIYNGFGTFKISGGKTTLSGALYIYTSYSSTGTSTLEISGGTTIISGEIRVYVGSEIEIIGGETTFSSSGVYVGYAHSSGSGKGKLEISGGTTNFEGTVYLGYSSGGAGMLNISGGNTTFEGTVYVGYTTSSSASATGTLEISGGETTFTGSVTVRSTGTVDISGGTITLSDAISNSGTVTFGENNEVVFVLDNLTRDGNNVYTLISGSGKIEGWDTLDKTNFIISSAEDFWEHLTVDVSTAGQVAIKVAALDLNWNGTADSNVWTTTDGEYIWKNLETGSDIIFFDGDSVTFGTDGTKSVSIVGTIEAGTVTVLAEGYEFVLAEYASVTATSLNIDPEASLTLTGKGTLTVSSEIEIYSSLQVSDEATLSVSKATSIYGTLEISEGGTANISNTLTVYDGGTLKISDDANLTVNSYMYVYDTLEISGGTTTISSTTYVYDGGTIDISGGTTKMAGMTVNDGGSVKISEGELNISGGMTLNSGGSLTISGGETNIIGRVYVYDTIEISGGEVTISYSSSSSSNTRYMYVYGALEISGGTTTISDSLYLYSGSSLDISGGSIETSSLNNSTTIYISGGTTKLGSTTNSGTIDISDGTTEILPLSNSGTLIISGGTTTISTLNTSGEVYISDGETTINSANISGDYKKFEISGGTVAFGKVSVGGDYSTLEIYDGEVTISEEMTLNSRLTSEISGGTTTISGDVYVYASSRLKLSAGETELSGKVSIYNNGTLEIYGGTTTIGGDSSEVYVYGALEISGGTTTISSDRVRIYPEGALNISGGTITLSSAISNSGTVTIDTSGGNTVVFVLDNLTSDNGTYTLIANTGKIEGWDTLTGSNFQLNGSVLGRSTVDVSTAGQVTITEVGAADLIWNGTSADNVWANGGDVEDWTNGGVADVFYNGDNVTFSSAAKNKNVSISERIVAGSVTVSAEGYTFTFSKGASVATDTLTIDSGASLTLAGSGELTTPSVTISGTLDISGGTVSVTDSLTSTGSISVSGGSLELSGTVDISSAISNSGTVTVSDSVTFVLNDGLGTTSDDGTIYTLITSGGTISGWDSLDYTNFVTSDGQTITSARQITFVTDGTILYNSDGFVADLVWNGTDENSVWAIGGENWLDDGSSDAFADGDSVTFDDTAESKTVTVEGSVNASSVMVKSGDYTFTGDGSITTESLVVDSGASLSLEGSGELTIDSATISGTLEISDGTITLSSPIENSGTVTVSDSVVFVLDNLESVDGTYTLISGGTIEGWDTLTKSNFTLDGAGLSGHSVVDVSTAGQITVTIIVLDLVWNGTNTDNIWTNDGKEIWLNGDDSDVFATGDNVTFGTGGEKSVSVSGAVEAGTITVSGNGYTFSFSDDSSVTASSLTIDPGASLTIEGANGTTTLGSVNLDNSSRGDSSFKISDGTLAISGDVDIHTAYSTASSNNTFEVAGGKTTIGGSVTIGSSDSISYGNGTFTVSDGTLTISGDVILDAYSNCTSTFEVAGGTATIEGSVKTAPSSDQGNNTLKISDGKITIEGSLELDASNGSSTLEISGGETIIANNVELSASGVSRAAIEVSGGMVTIKGDVSLEASSDGTSILEIYGQSAEVTISGEMKIGDNATLEVSSGSLSAETLSIESGSATLSGGTTNVETLTVSSSLFVSNNATLNATSASVSGTITLSGGTVSVTDSLTSTGSISVSGGSLELSGTVDISSAISNSGTVIVSDSTVFVLDNLTSDGDTYTIISGAGTIEGWDSLTKSNFQLNGSGLGRATVDVSTAGQVTVTMGGIGDLLWNGTSSSNVWTNDGDEIWLNGDDSDVFIENDNVTFGTDGTKSVSIVGKIEAGTVTVFGSGYTFTFSEDSSVTADSLTIDPDASLTLTGSGELTTDSATISGKLEITSGEATITSVEVSSEGTLKISGGATTADSIDVAGSIELTGGELTVKTIALSDGSGSFSGGTLNISEITGDGSLSFGDGLTVNLYETTSLSLTSDIALTGNVTFNAEDGETIELSGTLSGSGKLVKDGDGTLTLSGDNTFSGGTTISAGTVVAQSDTALGSGSIAIDEGATLQIPTSREFTNTTSGNGTLSITNNATVSFGSNVGVKTVEVTPGTTLSGSTTLTHSNAQLILAGELALDASAGEQVSFTNGGTVTLESSATLDLSGVSPTSVRPLSDSSEIGPGSNVTIVSGATVSGDIETFLATDNTLSDLSSDYAVVYDTGNGLSVMILESGNVSSITSGVKLHEGIGSDFISAIINDDDLDFGTGIKSSDELQSLSNPIVKALATGNISEASKMMNTLAPDDYAAMVAMPTTSFYNDVKAIDNRLAARRGPLDENARWEFFAQAQSTFIENDDANDTQTFDFDLYGVLAGADYRVNEGLTVGITVGYDYGKADIHNGGGKIESDDVRITVFAGQQIGEMFFVNAGAQVGYGHYEAKRKTAYGNANGDTDGWNAGLFADVGMMLTLSEELKISARPYVGLAYLHSEVGSFDDGLFDVDDFHGDSLRASIGCGVFWGFDLAETACSVGIDASYSHDFCGDEVDIDATYMDTGKDFGLTAKALSKDIFSVGPTVSVGLTKSIDIFAGYAFQAGTDSSTGHNLNAGLKVTF